MDLLTARPGGKRRLALLEIPLLLIGALCLTLAVKGTTAQAFSIPSSSMEPQLHVGDRVLVSRLAYRLHDPRRGDIVVFPSPAVVVPREGLATGLVHDALEALSLRAPEGEVLIKRVIGLPGETIEARGGRVSIDGRPLVEPYLPAGLATADFGPLTIPDGHVFVMGDNRPDSHDSRYDDVGPVPVGSLVGRAIGRIWPPGRNAFL